MAQAYAYRVRTRDGQIVQGTMEADSDTAVAQRLRSQNMVPLEITKETTSAGFNTQIKLPQRVKLRDLSVFSRQFATMIASGLSLLRALNILTEQTENPKLASTVAEVRDDVERGSSLSSAMARHPKVFNALFVSLVRAGETGGQLDIVLLRVADSFEKEYRLKQKIKSAMTYPVVVFIIAIVLVTIMLIFVVPTFANMFTSLGGVLPLPTRILLFISKKAIIIIPVVFIVSIVSFITYKRLHRTNEEFAFRADTVKLRMPVFGDLFAKIALARFARTLALLMRSGVPVLQALDITAEAAGNSVVARATLEVKASVREGESISSPLRAHKVFPPMVVQMIAVGEDTGQVDDMLDRIGDFYEQEVESTTQALTSLLEPMMIAVLGGLVGGMVVSLYLPMFKIFDLIK